MFGIELTAVRGPKCERIIWPHKRAVSVSAIQFVLSQGRVKMSRSHVIVPDLGLTFGQNHRILLCRAVSTSYSRMKGGENETKMDIENEGYYLNLISLIQPILVVGLLA